MCFNIVTSSWCLVHFIIYKLNGDFPGCPVFKTLPSYAGGVGSIPGWGQKIRLVSEPKNQNVKQKQYCKKFNKDFKKWYTSKNLQKNKLNCIPTPFIISTYFIYNIGASSVIQNPPANTGDVRDTGLISGLRRSPGVGNGNPFQDSCLENPMDRGTLRVTVHGAAKSQTQLSEHTHIAQWCIVKDHLVILLLTIFNILPEILHSWRYVLFPKPTFAEFIVLPSSTLMKIYQFFFFFPRQKSVAKSGKVSLTTSILVADLWR